MAEKIASAGRERVKNSFERDNVDNSAQNKNVSRNGLTRAKINTYTKMAINNKSVSCWHRMGCMKREKKKR